MMLSTDMTMDVPEDISRMSSSIEINKTYGICSANFLMLLKALMTL
jgi:hypothetical protein